MQAIYKLCYNIAVRYLIIQNITIRLASNYKNPKNSLVECIIIRTDDGGKTYENKRIIFKVQKN